MTRDELRERGKAVRSGLGLDRREPGEAMPGFDDLMAEVAYGSIWDRPHLARPDRMICTLAVLAPLQRLPRLEPMIGAALDLGLAPRSILEIFLQAGLYAGFVTAETAGHVAQKVFAARGVTASTADDHRAGNDELDARGRRLMEEMHGTRGTQGYAAPGKEITARLYPAAIRYGYGELWFRPGLDRRQRMLVAVAAFTALGLDGQLRKFARSALEVGLTRDEIVEAVIQTGPYGGFPRALNGLAMLSEVL